MIQKQSNTLNAFIKTIIDYAGLFPPANLPLNIAFENYINYRNSENNNFLSRFICPAGKLPELEIILKDKPEMNNDISISVLSSGGVNLENFRENFKEDLMTWKDFHKKFKDSVKTNSLEVRIPDDLIKSHNHEKLSEILNFISGKIFNTLGQNVFIFCECLISENWEEDFIYLINGISDHNLTENNSGFKLRTGGVTANAFPDSEIIAYAIKECLDRAVPMKCTAGLHHPFRHFDNEIGVMMHGFVNVFGAGIIAMRHNISHSELLKILNDENPENFIFTDEYFSWDKYKINVEDIELARNKLMISFGSCSFDDPVNDLKALNLL